MRLTLTGITWEHERGYDCVVAASRLYEREHPGIELAWTKRSLQAFADAPLERLAAEADLLVIDHPHVPLAAHAGLLARLDGAGFDDELAVLAAQSVGRSHESYAHDGHQYGLATDAAAQVAVHRPDLIAEPPREWDAVLELAAQGRVLWPAKPIDAFSSLITVAGSLGAVPAAEPGLFLAEDDLAAALAVLHRLTERVPEECLGWNPIQAAEALAASDRHAYVPLAFGYTNYARAGYRAHRLRYTDVPAGPAGIGGSLLGGAGIAVSARTTGGMPGAGSAGRLGNPVRAAAAREFAFWLASAEVQRGVYYDAGGQPGNAVAWDDDRLNADSSDFFRDTRATLESAYLRPRTAGYIAFQDRASPWVTATLRGELTDGLLARRMNEAAAELLAD